MSRLLRAQGSSVCVYSSAQNHVNLSCVGSRNFDEKIDEWEKSIFARNPKASYFVTEA